MVTNNRRIDTGRYGEKRAAEFLVLNGMDILEKNYRAEFGEIDIIARDGNTIVFVEVKTCKGDAFDAPETWVTRKKQNRIAKTAEAYLSENEIDEVDCRFDVIAIRAVGRNDEIKHIENAFWL